MSIINNSDKAAAIKTAFPLTYLIQNATRKMPNITP
jgi:hypothetical protein